MAEPPVQLREVLRPGSLLSELPEASLDALQRRGAARRLTKGQVLFQKGDDGTLLAIVLEGRLKISAFSVSGRETVLNILQPGDVVGEIAAIDGGLRTADALALEDTVIWQIPSTAISGLMEEDAGFAASLARALCRKLRGASDAVEAAALDMSRRAAAGLLRLAQQNEDEMDEAGGVLRLPVDQTTLAQYSGLSRSNMNRALKRFERTGAARHEQGILTILDVEWLRDFADSEDF